MPKHFLAIHDDGLESSTVIGVWDTLTGAMLSIDRLQLQYEADKRTGHWAAVYAVVEEWEADKLLHTYSRVTVLGYKVWEQQ